LDRGFSVTIKARLEKLWRERSAHLARRRSRRIADALADAIGRGDYPVGMQLPPEFASNAEGFET
jgi:hypothetical protein